MDKAISSNSVQPKKLLLSKWTEVNHMGKEKHFLVSKLHLPVEPEVKLEWVDVEAVHSKVARRIAWRDFKNASKWMRGWV